jgi:hypothetical protein
VGAGFSIAGFTYDGQYRILAESDADAAGGSEVFLRTYATLDDLLIDNKGPGGFSALNVDAGFSIAGFTYDGQYRILAESDADAAGGSEVFLRTYATFDDLLIDNKGPGGFSALNVGAGFSIAGMASEAAAPVPEPPVTALLALGLISVWFTRRRGTQFGGASTVRRLSASERLQGEHQPKSD